MHTGALEIHVTMRLPSADFLGLDALGERLGCRCLSIELVDDQFNQGEYQERQEVTMHQMTDRIWQGGKEEARPGIYR